MKLGKRAVALGLCAALALPLGACGGPARTAEPVALTVWSYYNGTQQQIFSELVAEFNDTVGREKGIVVTASSFGAVDDLGEKVDAALRGEVGADRPPDLFSAYADTAEALDRDGFLADLTPYFTQEELAAYVPGYLEEGCLGGEKLKIFPVAKTTEMLFVNKTAWTPFAQATGASEEDLATWEGITKLSRAYYEWTDGLTPNVPDDGSAFFGRDAFANYMLSGAHQLGSDLIRVEDGVGTVDLDPAVLRRLWDNYYVPYVNGWFTAYGNFRSDDMRTGMVAAYVGSGTSAAYFPDEVARDDGSTYPIEGAVYPLPGFAGGAPLAVQQGAGIAVTKSDTRHEEAAVAFLKWFTQPEQNSGFSAASGYLPVMEREADAQSLAQAAQRYGQSLNGMQTESMLVGMEMARDYEPYLCPPFVNSAAVRRAIGASMPEQAAADRTLVEAAMAAGASREEAVAPYLTDARFESWRQSFARAVERAEAGSPD